jgi:hypothetical protein
MGARIHLKSKIKTLENFFEKKFSKPFKKLYLKPLRGFRKNSLLLYIKEFQCFDPYKPARSVGLCTRSSACALVEGWGLKAPKVLILISPLG